MKRIRQALVLIPSCIISLSGWAQDKKIDVDINVDKKGSEWYQQPWVWIAAAAVFILLLVAILRGGKKE